MDLNGRPRKASCPGGRGSRIPKAHIGTDFLERNPHNEPVIKLARPATRRGGFHALKGRKPSLDQHSLFSQRYFFLRRSRLPPGCAKHPKGTGGVSKRSFTCFSGARTTRRRIGRPNSPRKPVSVRRVWSPSMISEVLPMAQSTYRAAENENPSLMMDREDS